MSVAVVIWPADEPDRPVRDSARTWEELEDVMRSNAWNPQDPKMYRVALAKRTKLWNGKTLSTAGSSRTFINALASTGAIKIATGRDVDTGDDGS